MSLFPCIFHERNAEKLNFSPPDGKNMKVSIPTLTESVAARLKSTLRLLIQLNQSDRPSKINKSCIATVATLNAASIPNVLERTVCGEENPNSGLLLNANVFITSLSTRLCCFLMSPQ